MFAYILRRLLWAVVLLIVLSIVTFSIFYLIPRLGGATPETLAARYVGRAATEETVHLTAERLGLLDPVPVQYWHWIKGVFVGASYDYGSGVERCPAPCLGYSFITKQPVWPELLDRAPVTISLVVGASLIWLVAGVSVGVISALRRGRCSTGALWALRWPVYRCRSSSPGWWRWHSSATGFVSPRPAAHTFPSVRTRRSGRIRCCCPGSPSPSCSLPSTPG